MTPTVPVILYGRPEGCPQCDATKRRLDKLNVAYVFVNVDTDPDAADTVRALGYRGVPVVTAGDIHWQGFRPDKIDALAVLDRGDQIIELQAEAEAYLRDNELQVTA